MKKGKPATLTSSLLARKGEAEPARLADGSAPKDVMALHEELVARVAEDVTRTAAASVPPMLPQDREDEPPADAVGLTLSPETTLPSPAVNEEEVDAEPAEEELSEEDGTEEDRVEENRALRNDDEEEEGVTLSDWAARPLSQDAVPPDLTFPRPTSPDHIPSGRALSAPYEDRPPKTDRSNLLPMALGIAVAAILSAWGLWYLAGQNELIQDTGQPAPQAAAPPAEAPPMTAARTPPPPAQPNIPAPEVATKPATPARAATQNSSAAPVAHIAGGFAVQLSSVKSEAIAAKQWLTISARFPALVEGHAHSIERADLGAKGTYYRLRLVGMTAADARAACKAFKAQGQDCLVVKR